MPTGNLEGALRIGEWTVAPALDSISRGTETHKLEPRTMRLLICLANSAGEVVSVDHLLTEVWTGVIVGPASVYQAVSQLRKLLGDQDPEPTYIATVPRKGYRLIAAVKPIETANETAPVAEGAATRPAPKAHVARPPVARRRWARFALGGIVVVALLVAAALMRNKSAKSVIVSADTNSIVVLPFVDMSADKAEQAFCDGLTEELANWLAQIPTLRVVARTSAFAFRGQGEDVRKIGRELGTSHILEGSMRRSGDHMRINVQLVDAHNGYRLWSDNFDRPVQDAIKIQEDVSRAVAQTLQVRLTADSERQFAARRTADPQTYQLYLLARRYQQQTTLESTDRAVDLYRQVLIADPKFALAYVGIAETRLNQGLFHHLPIGDVAGLAEPMIATALHLNPRMSEAYAVRGALRASQLRTKDALSDFQMAISLNPSEMGAFSEIGRMRLVGGQPRDALENYDRASALDPLNFTLQGARCVALDDLAQYAEAGNACERARVLQPGTATVADGLTWLAESQGLVEDALRWNTASLSAEPHDNFDFYWTRATIFLSIGLAAPARAAIELGRKVTKNDEDANTALLRVAYREGGVESLRRYLDSAGLDRSPHYNTLFEAAYARLLLGDAPAAKELIARAVAAPDRPDGYADDPWSARGAGPIGNSYRIDLAVAQQVLGGNPAAQHELDTVLAMLNGMIANGVERYGTYELRAEVYALEGRGDDAMRDLSMAAKLGWRSSWWAAHEPYFASLRARNDFQALIAQISRSNDRLTEKLKVDQ